MFKSILWLLILSLGCKASASIDRELIGGAIVDKGLYPEIAWIASTDGVNSWTCSATVIGPQVILTAGHCVKDQGSVSPAVKHFVIVDSVPYSTKCWQAPLYRDHKEDHDMALCKVDRMLRVKPASIAKIGPGIGQDVLLTGYGCTASDGSGGNDGTLTIGKVKVAQLPQGTDHWFYTEGKVALCYGDSGGPAMMADESHRVLGVNSRGDIEKLSLLTALFTSESISFMRAFARDQRVQICGITRRCP